jgi:superkiller protein 3
MDPQNADAINGKGVVQTRQRNYDAAIQLFRQAIDIRSDDAGYHANLAIVYHLAGRKDEALAAYRKAIELDPAYQGTIEALEPE